MKLRLLAGLVAVAASGCGAAAPTGCAGAQSCTRVLFIGNSYTAVNDLPQTFAALASSGGHATQTAMLADGGTTLAQHVASPATSQQLGAAHWDFVVLQEQSQIPSVAQ